MHRPRLPRATTSVDVSPERLATMRAVMRLYGINLKNYRLVPQTDLGWWVYQLERRAMFLRSLEEFQKQKIPRSYLGYSLYGLKPMFDDLATPKKGIRWPSVRHLKMADVCRLYATIPPPPKDIDSRVSRRGYEKLLQKSLFESDINLYGDPHRCFVEIDLLAADDVLIRDLEDLVLSARGRSGIQKRRKATHKSITTESVINWIDGNLLPYIDLKLAFGAQELTVSDPEIGALLYSRGDNEGGTTRDWLADRMKVPRKWFRTVMNDDFLRFLRTQLNPVEP